jgi:hypothetical protein
MHPAVGLNPNRYVREVVDHSLIFTLRFPFTASLPLDAVALISQTINSDQSSKAQSLILGILDAGRF